MIIMAGNRTDILHLLADTQVTMTRVIARSRPAMLSTAAFLVLGACSAETVTSVPTPAAPTGGWLTAQLTTPNNNDGAVQFSLAGPRIDSIKLATEDGFETHSATQADVIVTGTVTAGNLARIYVPDLSRTTEYRASVSAAATRDNYALQPLDGYRVVLVR